MRGNKNHPLNIETSEHRERKCSVASLTFSLLGVYQNSTVQCGQIGEIEKNTVYHLLGVTDEFCDVCGGVWWMPLMRNGVVEGRMEPQVVSKLHFKKCSYINCGVTSRNTTDGTSFHTFPIKDHDRCITWLVNCGLDDWVVENDSFFKHNSSSTVQPGPSPW
nr:uncharacterized protein LOC116425647 [Nomia melanderi]